MKRQNGFSLIELMVSLGILVTVVGLATAALLQAEHATQAIAYEANTQENLRAGMHFMIRDLAQAGEGIPEGGIAVPNNGTTSAIIRPGMGAGVTFPNPAAIPPNFAGGFLAFPAIVPGSGIGQLSKSVNPATYAVLTGNATDVINILYADDVLVDGTAAENHLYSFPVYQPTGPSRNLQRRRRCSGKHRPQSNRGIRGHGPCLLQDAGCHEPHRSWQPDHVSQSEWDRAGIRDGRRWK